MKKSVKTEPDEKYLADIEKMMKSWPATKGYVDKAIEAHEAAAHSEPETETGRREYMKVFSIKELIELNVMRHLLTAHERIAKYGDSKQIIELSRYILRLAKKRKNVLFERR